MLWVNIIIILIIGLYAWEGFRRGFLQQACDLLTVVIAIVLGLKFYPWAGSLFEHWGLSPEISRPLGFISIWLIAQSLFRLLIWAIFKLVPDKWETNLVNKIFGIIPGICKGILIMAIVLMLFIVWPISSQTKDTLTQYPVSGFLIKSSAKIETQLQKIFGPLNNLTFFTNIGQNQEMTKLNFTVSRYTIDSAGENQMLILVNADRAKVNLPPLVLDSAISEVARNHSIDMARNGYFSHYDLAGKTPADRMTAADIGYTMAGENIALVPTVDLAEVGFMNSQKHRDNILSPDFSRIGIGIIDTGTFGKMVTQNFAN